MAHAWRMHGTAMGGRQSARPATPGSPVGAARKTSTQAQTRAERIIIQQAFHLGAIRAAHGRAIDRAERRLADIVALEQRDFVIESADSQLEYRVKRILIAGHAQASFDYLVGQAMA